MNWKKHQPVLNGDGSWDTGLTEESPEVKECGHAKCPDVNIGITVLRKMDLLMEKYKSDEWAADLIGFFDPDDNEYWVLDLRLFEQEVTASSVERKEPEGDSVIGVTHSHHTMGAFMSGTDDEYPNSNYNLSGVVSRKTDGHHKLAMKFSIRVKTPCGCYRYFEVEKWYMAYHYEDFDVKEFLALADKKINKKTYVTNFNQFNYLNQIGTSFNVKANNVQPVSPVQSPAFEDYYDECDNYDNYGYFGQSQSSDEVSWDLESDDDDDDDDIIVDDDDILDIEISDTVSDRKVYFHLKDKRPMLVYTLIEDESEVVVREEIKSINQFEDLIDSFASRTVAFNDLELEAAIEDFYMACGSNTRNPLYDK